MSSNLVQVVMWTINVMASNSVVAKNKFTMKVSLATKKETESFLSSTARI